MKKPKNPKPIVPPAVPWLPALYIPNPPKAQ